MARLERGVMAGRQRRQHPYLKRCAGGRRRLPLLWHKLVRHLVEVPKIPYPVRREVEMRLGVLGLIDRVQREGVHLWFPRHAVVVGVKVAERLRRAMGGRMSTHTHTHAACMYVRACACMCVCMCV